MSNVERKAPGSLVAGMATDNHIILHGFHLHFDSMLSEIPADHGYICADIPGLPPSSDVDTVISGADGLCNTAAQQLGGVLLSYPLYDPFCHQIRLVN